MICIDLKRDLVRPKRAFHLETIDELRACPSLGRIQDNHGPMRSFGIFVLTSILLDPVNLFDDFGHYARHPLVHKVRVVPSTKYGFHP